MLTVTVTAIVRVEAGCEQPMREALLVAAGVSLEGEEVLMKAVEVSAKV